MEVPKYAAPPILIKCEMEAGKDLGSSAGVVHLMPGFSNLMLKMSYIVVKCVFCLKDFEHYRESTIRLLMAQTSRDLLE